MRAVAALREWLVAAGITSGPIFRLVDRRGRIGTLPLIDRSIANIVKAYAARAGFDPAAFAGHSLRVGFLTSAAAHGANLFKMADQNRHKNLDVSRGYVRSAELFPDHVGSAFL